MYQNIAKYLPFFAWPRRASAQGNITDTLTKAAGLLVRLRSPFFLLVHIHEPHGPFHLPDDFKPLPIRIDRRAGDKAAQLEFYAPYLVEFQPLVDVYRGLYESSVKRLDSELGEFFKSLDATPGFGNAMVIVAGDHGESFERGYFLHGEELFENSTQVPLVIRYPGQKGGERLAGLTQSIDIAPTILNVLAIPKPDWMEGQSLKSGAFHASAETIAINYKRPYDGVVHYFPTKIAIWWNRYKLIAACQNGAALLYDLESDPKELVNISARELGVVEELKRRLKARLFRQSAAPRLSCPNL